MVEASLVDSINVSSDGFAVTPSDSTVFASPPRLLYIGTGGHVTLETMEGTTLTYKNVPSGRTLLMRTRRVLAATTAQDIIAQK